MSHAISLFCFVALVRHSCFLLAKCSEPSAMPAKHCLELANQEVACRMEILEACGRWYVIPSQAGWYGIRSSISLTLFIACVRAYSMCESLHAQASNKKQNTTSQSKTGGRRKRQVDSAKGRLNLRHSSRLCLQLEVQLVYGHVSCIM